MPEQQDIQSLLRFEEWQSLFPFEQNDRCKALMSMVSFEDKKSDRFEALNILLKDFLAYEVLISKALTEEDRRYFEEEKQLFFKKTGFDEDTLKDIIKHGIDCFLRAFHSSTDEELKSICKERDRFLEGLNYETALDKFIQEKKQKSIANAA